MGADTQSIFGYLWRKSEPVKKEIPSNSPIFFGGGEFERIYMIIIQPCSFHLHKVRDSPEYSHLSWLEKGSSLLDIPEAERLAILILKGLKNNDITHYNSLCKKIDADPNIV